MFDSTSVSDTASDTRSIVRHSIVSLSVSPDKTLVSSVGEDIVYSFSIVNTGNTTLSSLSLTDEKLAWVNVSCGAASLQPGQSTGCSGTYAVSGQDIADGGVANTSTVNGSSPTGAVDDTKTTFVTAATSPENPTAPIRVNGGL